MLNHLIEKVFCIAYIPFVNTFFFFPYALNNSSRGSNDSVRDSSDSVRDLGDPLQGDLRQGGGDAGPWGILGGCIGVARIMSASPAIRPYQGRHRMNFTIEL